MMILRLREIIVLFAITKIVKKAVCWFILIDAKNQWLDWHVE